MYCKAGAVIIARMRGVEGKMVRMYVRNYECKCICNMYMYECMQHELVWQYVCKYFADCTYVRM